MASAESGGEPGRRRAHERGRTGHEAEDYGAAAGAPNIVARTDNHVIDAPLGIGRSEPGTRGHQPHQIGPIVGRKPDPPP